MRLLLLPSLAGLVAAQCYYPDGNEATDYNYQPCGGANTTFSQCCIFEEGDTCLPNGLCNYPEHYTYRAACADQTWGKCQEVCPKSDTWIEVKSCATDEYCCNEDVDNGDCCKDDSDRFDLSSPSPSETSSSPTSTQTDLTASATDETDGSTGGGGALSTGAKGAIGGVIGGVAAIAIGIGAWWMVRRKKRSSGSSGGEVPPAELAETEGKKIDGGYYALGGVAPTEMDGSSVAVESDSRPVERREVHEMSG